MRILHVLDHSLPVHSGYTFRTRAILKAQIEHGLGGRRADRRAPGARPGRIAGDRRRPDLLPHAAPARRRRRRCANGARSRRSAARLDEVVGEWQPDQLHVHSPVLNALAAMRVARRHKLPLVYEIRAFWEDAAVGNGTDREGSARYRVTQAAGNPRRALGRCGGGDLRGAARRSGRARHRGGQDHGLAQRRRSRTCSAIRRRPIARCAASSGSTAREVVGFIGSLLRL